MCSLHITFKASVSICVRPQKDGRWQIGRKAPSQWRLAKGQMSPQHLLQARVAAQPCYASHQCRKPVATGYCGSNWRRSERKGEQWVLLGRDDREDNNSIGLTEEIIPLLSCCYTIPPHTWYLLSFWFVPLFSCLLYLPFQQPSLPAAVEIIPLASPADFSCWSSCFSLFVLNTAKTP